MQNLRGRMSRLRLHAAGDRADDRVRRALSAVQMGQVESTAACVSRREDTGQIRAKDVPRLRSDGGQRESGGLCEVALPRAPRAGLVSIWFVRGRQNVLGNADSEVVHRGVRDGGIWGRAELDGRDKGDVQRRGVNTRTAGRICAVQVAGARRFGRGLRDGVELGDIVPDSERAVQRGANIDSHVELFAGGTIEQAVGVRQIRRAEIALAVGGDVRAAVVGRSR